jgi:hypothetical protein
VTESRTLFNKRRVAGAEKARKDKDMAKSFDEISKTLSSGVSRRTALRLMGAGVGGAALAALGLGEAKAAPNQCAAFCSFFHGAFQATCRQACQKCGSNPNNLCFSFSPSGGGPPTGVTCCQGGFCCPSATNTSCCQPGMICCNALNSVCCDPATSTCSIDQTTGNASCVTL